MPSKPSTPSSTQQCRGSTETQPPDKHQTYQAWFLGASPDGLIPDLVPPLEEVYHAQQAQHPLETEPPEDPIGGGSS